MTLPTGDGVGPGHHHSSRAAKGGGVGAAQASSVLARLFDSSDSATAFALSTKAWIALPGKSTLPASATDRTEEPPGGKLTIGVLPSTASAAPSVPLPSRSSKSVRVKGPEAGPAPWLATVTATEPPIVSVRASQVTCDVFIAAATRSGYALTDTVTSSAAESAPSLPLKRRT